MRRLALLFKLAFRNVFRQRARSALALATIASGSAGLLLFMGFNASVMRAYRTSTVRTRYAHGALFAQGYRGRIHARPWEHWIDNAKAAEDTLKALPAVAQVFPRLTLMAFLVKDDTTLVAVGEGIDGAEEAKFFDQLNYVEGTHLGAREDAIVLGRGLASGLDLHAGDEVDISVRDIHGNMQLETLKVGGIFFTGVPMLDDSGFRCALPVAQRLLGTTRVESLYVALRDDEGWPAFAQDVSAAVPTLEAVPFDTLDEVYYKHGIEWLQAQFNVVRAIILFIVFLAIFNVMTMSVFERTVEIGTLRANGESKREVALAQTLEAVVVGVLGAFCGIALGWLMAQYVLSGGIQLPPAPGFTRSFRIFIRFAWGDAGSVLVLSAVTTALGCAVPVWRVLRQPIAEALRHR